MRKSINRSFFTTVVIIFFGLANHSNSEEMDEKTRAVMTNFLYELSECTMYFSILGEGKGNSESSIINENYKMLGEEMALATFQIAKTIGMKQEALMTIMQRYSKEMGDQISNDGINISILVEKHGSFCKELVEDPAKRLIYWQKKS